jgi:hypothetical protein
MYFRWKGWSAKLIGQGQSYTWGYDSTREGAKGAKAFYYILFTHLGISWENGYVSFLGRPHGALLHVLFKPCFWLLGGSSIIVTHSSFILAHSCSWF